MKKIVLVLILFITYNSQAQIFADGTVITSFSATDINNDVFSSTIATNNGKHIVIDFSATWCGNCWNYHGTGVLDNYNSLYGPNGTAAQDAEVLFYESDASTNDNDLNGVGTNTVGDWVTGSNYKIFNESNPTPVKSSFANNGGLGYPTVFVVCSDRKMYRLATSITNATDVRNFVNTKCGLNPLSANTVHAASFSYEVYPNPTSANVKVDLNIDGLSNVRYDVYSSIGQKVLSQNLNKIEGKSTIDLETATLQSGLYILNITVDGEKITEKIIVE